MTRPNYHINRVNKSAPIYLGIVPGFIDEAHDLLEGRNAMAFDLGAVLFQEGRPIARIYDSGMAMAV